MSTALEFRLFVAGSALEFSIFTDRIVAKDGLDSLVVFLLAPFIVLFSLLLPWVANTEG